MARKPVNQMVNQFFHERKDIDLAIFVTYDNEIKTNVIRCLASNDLKCDEKFLTEINHKNITSIFQHLTQCHGAYYPSNQTFNLLFHAGEINCPEEYLPTNYGDGVSTFENIYSALVLRTRRIGHGLSLANRPDIYQYIRQNQIAIEVCPARNQILGFVADLRNHPGIVYHRSGIPIVLAGDDPGSFGYNQLTIEFYLATMAWGLNLADLKQFAWNSIQYSSLPSHRKIQGFKK